MRSWDSVVEYLNKAELNLRDPASIQQNSINTSCDDHQNSQLQVQIELLA